MTETRRRSLSIAIEDDNVDWNVATGKRGSTRLGPPNLRRLAIRLHGALCAGMELEPRTSRSSTQRTPGLFAAPPSADHLFGAALYRHRQAPIAVLYILYLCFVMGDLIFESLTELEFQCSSSEASHDAAWREAKWNATFEEACRYADYQQLYLQIDFWCLAFFMLELALEVTVAGRAFVLNERGRVGPEGVLRLCDAAVICSCFVISFLALFVCTLLPAPPTRPLAE
jgi:hypothetical protein